MTTDNQNSPVAPQGVVAWMHPETLDVIHADRKQEWATRYGLGGQSKAEGYSVAMVRADQSAAGAAPAPEAPAAPVRQVLTDAQITHLQETRVGEPSPSRPIDASDWMNFARAIEAAALAAPAAPVDDLAQLVKKLVRALRKAAPGNDLADKALDYLKRKGLQGSPLLAAPAAPAVDAWLQPDDMAALQRFHETAEDDESYDIGKEAVARLCAFGCLQSHSFGRYSTTDFGDYLLDTWAGARTLPFTTAAEREALAAQAAAKGAA